MPSKKELMERKSVGGDNSDDESEMTSESSKGKGVKGFFKGMKSKIKGKGSGEGWKDPQGGEGTGWVNGVNVKVTKKDTAEFSDLLHLTTIPPATSHPGGGHKGPVWVMR